MKAKLRQLARLRALREAHERLSEAAVGVAAGKMREAERRLREVEARQSAEGMEARRALQAGEVGWRFAEALRMADACDRRRLQGECGELRLAMQVAERELEARRIEAEQAKVLERGVLEATRIAEERMMQSASDDRFLSRRQRGKLRSDVNSLME